MRRLWGSRAFTGNAQSRSNRTSVCKTHTQVYVRGVVSYSKRYHSRSSAGCHAGLQRKKKLSATSKDRTARLDCGARPRTEALPKERKGEKKTESTWGGSAGSRPGKRDEKCNQRRSLQLRLGTRTRAVRQILGSELGALRPVSRCMSRAMMDGGADDRAEIRVDLYTSTTTRPYRQAARRQGRGFVV